MPTTTIHVPEDLLRDIDRAAESEGVSRNRYVLAALREALARNGGAWPEGFFRRTDDQADQALLREATVELEREITRMRTNRGAAAL